MRGCKTRIFAPLNPDHNHETSDFQKGHVACDVFRNTRGISYTFVTNFSPRQSVVRFLTWPGIPQILLGESRSSDGSALGFRPPGRAIDPVSGVCFITKFASLTQVAPRPKYSLISAKPGLKQHSFNHRLSHQDSTPVLTSIHHRLANVVKGF